MSANALERQERREERQREMGREKGRKSNNRRDGRRQEVVVELARSNTKRDRKTYV